MRHLGLAGCWTLAIILYWERTQDLVRGPDSTSCDQSHSVVTFVPFHLRKGTDTAADIHMFCFEYSRVFRVHVSVNLKYS